MKKDFEQPDEEFHGETSQPTDPTGITETPLQYFKKFVTQEMLEMIVTHANRYSIQKQGTCINTSLKEIEQVLGMYFKMGLVEMPAIRMYWEQSTRYPAVADVMCRNRFQLLLRMIHFVDNLLATDEIKKDKVWKLRPFLELFRKQCLQVTPDQHHSIDEMMIPYKGKFSKIRQYIKGKPHPWGFKVWCRCAPSGLLHDFDVYQGKGGEQRKNEFGVGGDAVVKMCETLEKRSNYKIYSDNFFTSVKLVEKLSTDGFLYAGTVKQNCLGKELKNAILSEKVLSQKGRGSHDVRVESHTNIVCVRWLDTKAVTLMSNYAGPEPFDKARRWDKSKKEFTDVYRPFVVKEYNTYMGGMDTLDSHLAKCKFSPRTRRWYMVLFWHFISLGLINAWLLYRSDCDLLKLSKKGIMKLRQFQGAVAEGPIEVGVCRKHGPPSLEEETPKARRLVRVDPCQDSRFDQTGHWPEKKEKRCRCAVCKSLKTDTYCEKCDIPLCFNECRNCFKAYHIK